MSHIIGRGRYARETYPESPRQQPVGSDAVATVQVGGSAAATSVQLDSAPFSLPAGMTRVKVDAFISVQPATAGEQVQYSLLFDGSPVLPSGGGGVGTLSAFGQTGAVVDKFKERKRPQGEVETGAAPCSCGLVGYHLNLTPFLS